MKERFYQAFTLVEMLIVMGILIILMVIGVAAGRFAINRANDVAHQNAADQIYQGLQAYYTDFREFPASMTPQELIGEGGLLDEFLEGGDFKGGSPATFYYISNEAGTTFQRQSVLVCVTLGGIDDVVNDRGIYCTGNGFRDAGLTISGTTNAGNLDKNLLDSTDDETLYDAVSAAPNSAWHGATGWTAPATP
jgi:type II secretory pathway pseudopilin PulG